MNPRLGQLGPSPVLLPDGMSMADIEWDAPTEAEEIALRRGES
jgi:hypothetical protein